MQTAKTKLSYEIRRHFTRAFTGKHPLDAVEWNRRDVEIKASKESPAKHFKGVEAPTFWSDRAVRVAADKYFMGHGEDRENSVRQIIARVTTTIARAAVTQGLLDAPGGKILEEELAYLLLHQKASFNSPVWFNVGREKDPQCSACFILEVQDSMEGILDWIKTEGLLFKHGSGSGVNLSRLRASGEKLSGGGHASGPVSFMKGADASAGSIRSGGRTRRAAKMVILDCDHPDVLEFIETKAKEERKGKALIESGFEGGLDGDVYTNLQFQNANNSVRVSDAFMQAVKDDASWGLVARKDGQPMKTLPARAILHAAAKAAWECGDPGIQYHSTINRWNTVAASGEIVGSNPCSEYMFLNNTSCNLASLNLVAFLDKNGAEFLLDDYMATIEILALAMETLVDMAGYPTALIGENTRRYRTLGMGYTNLGAMLLKMGVAYDSDAGRALAAELMSAMTAGVYAASAKMAEVKGPFQAWSENKEPFREVMAGHYRAHTAFLDEIRAGKSQSQNEDDAFAMALHVSHSAEQAWKQVLSAEAFRNAQATVLAPTGTISFLMDCKTTGIEPYPGLSYRKDLVGGDKMYFVEKEAVMEGLQALGYSPQACEAAIVSLEASGKIEEGVLKSLAHAKVFQTAFGEDPLGLEAHIEMMAAVQPFVSGAISKTVNLPASASVEDIERVYTLGWERGLKALAVYRDGSKGIQVLSTTKSKKEAPAPATPAAEPGLALGVRKRLPQTRQSLTHKFNVAGQEGYITVGTYEDGTPGELFVLLGKDGSTLQGLTAAWATSVSVALQYGAPLSVLVDKMKGTRFEPHGFTQTEDLRSCSSIVDYIGRWIEMTFVERQLQLLKVPESKPLEAKVENSKQLSGKTCTNCGHLMHQKGTCFECSSCGASSGGCS